MSEFIINSRKDLEEHKDSYGYHVKGDCEINCSLIFNDRLLVNGNLNIKAYRSIEAGGYIKACGYIKAGWSIEARGYIEAWGSIKADWFIKVVGYIKAGGSIEACGYIKAGGSIEAGRSIEARGYIEAGGSIEAGARYGISAGLSITCKNELIFGLKAFAGACIWRETLEEEKTITCGKFNGGVVGYGILKETGIKKDTKKIIIDGKEIEISNESFESLKKQLT